MNASPCLTITPDIALVDQPVRIAVSGLAPNQEVTLRLSMTRLPGITLEASSFAVFQADEAGVVDVTRQKPLTGSYDDVDSMGLFWSMQITRTDVPRPEKLEDFQFDRTIQLRCTAECDGLIVAAAECTRVYQASHVQTQMVREDGLAALFFVNPDAPPSPGILVLGGSEGGLVTSSHYAALFASHGFPSLALAYFQCEHLPKRLENIPLEYFETAIKWMQRQPAVSPEQIAVFGRSKGAECALLIGSTYPQIKAVVASVPSSVVCIGSWSSSLQPDVYNPQSSWSHHGIPMPFIRWTEEQCREAMALIENNQRFDHIHRTGLDDPVLVEQVRIPVERINGSILLISGDDDHYWPTDLHCRMITDRLRQANFPHPYQHLHYPETGHMIRHPYIPTTRVTMNGGSAKQNAYATADSWKHVLHFLKKAFS